MFLADDLPSWCLLFGVEDGGEFIDGKAPYTGTGTRRLIIDGQVGLPLLEHLFRQSVQLLTEGRPVRRRRSPASPSALAL